MFTINTDIQTEKRYDISKFMSFQEGYDILDSKLVNSIKSLPLVGTYLVQREPDRPDVLSYNIYKDTQFWWILMIYNDLVKPQDIILGMEIRYFSISDLENIYFSLKIS